MRSWETRGTEAEENTSFYLGLHGVAVAIYRHEKVVTCEVDSFADTSCTQTRVTREAWLQPAGLGLGYQIYQKLSQILKINTHKV